MEQRLNQVSLLILVPVRFPREELSPNLVAVISLHFKQWIKGSSPRAGVWLWLVGRAAVTTVESPGSAALGLGALSSAALPLGDTQLFKTGSPSKSIRSESWPVPEVILIHIMGLARQL